jgi:hypothetical protein
MAHCAHGKVDEVAYILTQMAVAATLSASELESLCDLFRRALDHVTLLRLRAVPQHGGCIAGSAGKDKVWAGLGRIVALYDHPSTSYQIH